MHSKLEAIKKVVVEANPDIEHRNVSVQIPEPFGGLINYRDTTIRLVDIFLAMSCDGWTGTDQENANIVNLVGAYWNLFEDDLTKQRPETIDFLHTIFYP